jgi:hypothetical protein
MDNVNRSIERPLGNFQWLLDSFWAILKVCWKATGKGPNKLIPAGQVLLLAGCDEKSRKWDHQLIENKETRRNCPAAIGKKKAISIHFLHCTSAYIYKKSKKQWKIRKTDSFFSTVSPQIVFSLQFKGTPLVSASGDHKNIGVVILNIWSRSVSQFLVTALY